MRRLRRDERGVTMVEAAFVIPILFLFIFALIDIGLWVFETSQASSAARDGARAGIVLRLNGSTGAAKTANETTIRNAVVARLADNRITDPTNDITITCLTSADAPVNCENVASGSGRLRVTVRWQRPFLTFVGGIFGGADRTVTGKATMVVVGRPSAG